MSEQSLRILLVEDSPADARLILYALRQAGLNAEVTRVDCEADFLAHLDLRVDAILCDFMLPQFNALRALELTRERCPDVPFLIVSGSIGEETAVHAIKQGATDYLLKDRLGRLGTAVRQALAQRQLQQASRRAQEALLASEAQYRALAESIPQLVWMARPDGSIEYVNQRMVEYTGLLAQELTGTKERLLIHPDDRVQLLAQRSAVPHTGTLQPVEFRIRRADGEYRWHIMHYVPIRDPAGRIVKWVGTCTDIHDRKAAAELLARDALMLASVRDSVIVTDLAGIITYWNEGATRLFGWTAEERVGRPHVERYPESFRAELAEGMRQWKADGEWSGEYEDFRKDGSRVWIHARVSAFTDASGRRVGLLGVAHDITTRLQAEEARRKLEAQYRQGQKMEAFGQLAGGVAHDFNNLLTVINGSAELLLAESSPQDHQRDLLAAIRDAGERAAGLTAQLLAFSRKTLVEPKVLDLNEVVEHFAKMLRRVLGEDIVFVPVFSSALGRVKMDRGQLDQVIMNLSVNARDAMPTGGRLTIETKNCELRKEQLPVDGDCRPGQYVALQVADTGCGMTDAVKAKIFEPFFTTKEVGKGSGMGLATVYGIAKTYGGHIEVWSELNRGTTVTVFLPAVADALPAKSAGRAMPSPSGNEALLIVEDEPMVRRFLRVSLERHGYKVLEAKDGADAIQVAERHTGPIHLLLADVVMPGMGGREVAKQVVARHAGVKVLYLSGYTDDALVRHGIVEATDAFLQKPFTPASLAAKVRKVLDGGK